MAPKQDSQSKQVGQQKLQPWEQFQIIDIVLLPLHNLSDC